MVLLVVNCCSSMALKGGAADLYQLKISLGVLDVLFRVLGSQYIRNHCGGFAINIQVLWYIIPWTIPLISEAEKYSRGPIPLISLGLWFWAVSAQPASQCAAAAALPCFWGLLFTSCAGLVQHLLGWAGASPLTSSGTGSSGILKEIKWQLLM